MWDLRKKVCSSSPSLHTFNSVVGSITSPEETRFWNHHIPIKKLGSGANGIVVAAVRLKDRLSVAVKTMRRVDVDYAREGVPEEVVALSLVAEIEGAIRILSWFDTKDKVFIVMELPHYSVELGKYVKSVGRVSESVARKILTQLVSTINAMAEIGVLHRDLKVDNILVDRRTLKTKIIDFGLTSMVSSFTEETSIRMGTSRYKAPEMITRNKYIPGPGLVWTVGVIAFFTFTGSLPFEDQKEIIRAKPNYPTNVSKDCMEFLKGCFSVDPAIRTPLNKLASHPWLQSSPKKSSFTSNRINNNLKLLMIIACNLFTIVLVLFC